MSFPPNLGITTSFLFDPTGSLLIQDLPSLLPQLEQICSPFSKHRMNGYSRIKKHTSARSKSVDFADLSRNLCCNPSPKFKSQATRPNFCSSILEQDDEDETGEVFGIILSRKCSVSSGTEDQKVGPTQESSAALQSAVEKRSFSVQRSASVSEGYSRIHHQFDIAAEDEENSSLNANAGKKKKKKKGKFLRVFKRLFGL